MNRALRHLLPFAILTLSCSGDDTSPDDTGNDAADAGPDGSDASDVEPDPTTDTQQDAAEDAEPDVAPDAVPDATQDADTEDTEPPPPNPDCDPLVAQECAMPWPSNLYLEPDPARATGFTLSFGATSLPDNFRDVHVGPEIYRRLDGYGVSTPILAHFPNLDVDGLATDFDVTPSLDEDALIQFFAETDAGLERVPYFVELDAWEEDPAQQTLWVRPAVILEEATRYVIAFRRGLADTAGDEFVPTEEFAALVSGDAADHELLAPRAERFDDVFASLESAGVDRDDLVLAWDFNTASSDALHSHMLEIRREGFEAAGESGPPITVTEWTDYTPEEHEHWASVVRGFVTVPHFMREHESGGVIGWTFNEQTEGDGLVEQNGTREAEFWIGIPHSASDGTPHGLAQYGHGFFGLGDGTTGDWTPHGSLANEANLIWFGCNWTGMSDHDFGNISFAVFDLNNFRWLTDRMHQGQLEFLLFARAMRERFPLLDEVTERGFSVDTSRMFYEGISQGGINGAVYMALTNDIERGHLGVPGQNYSLMAHRSENFDQFFGALAGSYNGRSKQAVVIATIQTLWDTIDPVSYYRHIIAEPFEDDEPRQILATPSLGDHSVTPLAMEIVARTPGLGLELFRYDPDRDLDLVETAELPSTGSGLVFYSWPGQRRTESVNQPAPRGDVNVHDAQRWLEVHQEQMLHFWETGEIIDTCTDGFCDPD